MNVCQVGHEKHDRKLVETKLGQMWVYDVDKYNDNAGFYCTGQDAISGSLILQGSWEDVDTEVIEPILQKGDRNKVVVDFGSHIGWYTLMAAKLGYQVIAIDADAENLELLMDNAKLHKVDHLVHTLHAWVEKDFKIAIDSDIELVKVDIEGQDDYAVNSIDLNRVQNLYVEISPAFNGRYPKLVKKIKSKGFKAYYPNNKPFDNDFSLSQINLRFSR